MEKDRPLCEICKINESIFGLTRCGGAFTFYCQRCSDLSRKLFKYFKKDEDLELIRVMLNGRKNFINNFKLISRIQIPNIPDSENKK